ncbi:hypothetical protein Fot_23905 [Forsythia ovata]|uniref:Uncharacterized protein n=1 Tax=Forsythia ovata TaxID=205694 RepID=A0ABD1U4Q8_9LAMI
MHTDCNKIEMYRLWWRLEIVYGMTNDFAIVKRIRVFLSVCCNNMILPTYYQWTLNCRKQILLVKAIGKIVGILSLTVSNIAGLFGTRIYRRMREVGKNISSVGNRYAHRLQQKRDIHRCGGD